MKCVSISAFIFVFASFAFAQPAIKIQPHVQSYLQEKGAKHRSGLLSAKDYSSNYEEVREGERVQLVSFENIPSKGKELSSIASKVANGSFQSVRYYDDANIVRLDSSKSGFKADIGNLKKNQNQESKKLLKSLFPDSIAKQFDLFVVGTEYIGNETTIPQAIEYRDGKNIEANAKPQTESKISSPAKENGYMLLFQRVYKGRVIRSFDSHLNIAIDKDGYVKNMEIAWQDLLPIGEFASISNNSKEISQALEMAAKLDYSEISRAGDTFAVKSFEANGVAKAWCKEKIGNGKNALFPCLSYSGNIEVSNGEIVPTVIDAPYSVSYKTKSLIIGGNP